MPQSVNGIGTGLLRASSKRSFQGLIQFDGIEAVMVGFMPIIPYKVVHVVAYAENNYQSLRLRFAPRIIAKAFLLSWSRGLLLFGGLFAVIMIVVFVTMERTANESDIIALTVSLSLLAAGLLAWGSWWLLERKDDSLRRLFGATPLGTSDPQDWPDELAQPVLDELLHLAKTRSLAEAAHRLDAQGERSKAAVSARLAERRGEAMQVRELFDRWLKA